MKNLKIISIIAIIILITTGTWLALLHFAKPLISELTPNQLTTEQKLEDFEYLYDIMEENYPFFEVKKRMINYDWLAHKEEFKQWIRDTKNDREYYNTVDRIVNLMQSGHTNLVGYEFYQEVADLYSDPLQGYSPARKKVLKNELVAEKIGYWNRMLTTYDYYMPIIFRYIEGSYVVFEGELEKYDIPKGSILQKVGIQDTEAYIESLRDKIYLQYDYKRKKQIASELYIFTQAGEVINFTFKTPDGRTISRDIKQEEMSEDVYDRLYENYNERNFRTEILEKNKIAYIRMSSMEVFDDEQYDKDEAEIFQFLQKVEEYPYLIIDIRGNGGGSTGYWSGTIVSRLIQKSMLFSVYLAYRDTEYITPFINDRHETFNSKYTQELPENKNYPPEIRSFGRFLEIQEGVLAYNPLHFKGKIYLLVDGGVYSAAESFSVFAKTTKWATLVGTTTGGDGIGAEPGYLSLPNSGILVRTPVAAGLNPDGSINEETHTPPDIYVEPTYEDFLKQLENEESPLEEISQHDTILNHVLNLIKQAK